MSENKYIGLDVGGTKIKAGLLDSSWNIIKTTKILTDAKGGLEVVLNNICGAIEDVWDDDVKGIGVGFAGLTDSKNGIVLKAPNFPEEVTNINLSELLSEKFKTKVCLDNDVHCFTLAEATVGVAKGKETVFGMTIGTGIGGGLVVNGKIFRGAQNAAGEIGHTTIDLDSNFTCGCGEKGHLESMGSWTALSKNCSKNRELMSYQAVLDAIESNDKIAGEALELFQNALKAGFQNIIYSYNPDTIVIGGGITGHSHIWKPAATSAIAGLIYNELKNTEIIESVLGDGSNVIGAAMLCTNC